MRQFGFSRNTTPTPLLLYPRCCVILRFSGERDIPLLSLPSIHSLPSECPAVLESVVSYLCLLTLLAICLLLLVGQGSRPDCLANFLRASHSLYVRVSRASCQIIVLYPSYAWECFCLFVIVFYVSLIFRLLQHWLAVDRVLMASLYMSLSAIGAIHK